MCKWGTDHRMRVFIPADCSHTGEERWAIKPVDACIAPIVKALNDAGIVTTSSCCGHGKARYALSSHPISPIKISTERPENWVQRDMRKILARAAQMNEDVMFDEMPGMGGW